jgi:hypothetical protein
LKIVEQFLKSKRLIFSVLFRSAVLAVLLPHSGNGDVGILHGKTSIQSIPQMGGGGLERISISGRERRWTPVVFSKPARAREYTATFIDRGYCFNAGESSIPDSALRGVYARNSVYQQITGSEFFEPPLSRPSRSPFSELWRLAGGMPEDWYQCNSKGLSRLIHTLYDPCTLVRNLTAQFRTSSRNPFPNWKD